jgi:hypothetical protein
VVRRVWVHSHVLEAKNWNYSCLLASYWGTDTAVVCSTLRIPWYVPYERPNLPANSKILPHELSLTILWTFFMFLSVWPESSQTSTEVLHISIEKTTQKPVLPLVLVNESCFYHFMHFQWTLFEFKATQMFYSFRSKIAQLSITISMHNIYHLLISIAEGNRCKSC